MFNLLHLPFKIGVWCCCHIIFVLLFCLFISYPLAAQTISEKQGQDTVEVTQPFSLLYYDFNIDLILGMNTAIGVLIKRTHGFGISLGLTSGLNHNTFINSGNLLGFQYRLTPINAPGALKRLLIRAEYGKVMSSYFGDDSNFILRPDLNNDFYIRGAIGFRMRAIFLGLSFLHSGRQGIAYPDYNIPTNPPYNQIAYYHLDNVFLELGIAIPAMLKTKKKKFD